jgi:hypothetical protein
VGGSQPVHEAGIRIAAAEQRVNRSYERSDRRRGESGGHQDDPGMGFARRSLITVQEEIVGAITRDDGPALALGEGEDVTVGKRAEVGAFDNGEHVMTARAQCIGDCWRDHFIEEDFHPSAAWRRCQLA